MQARKIREGIHWVGAVDWARRLFDELVPLPEGTSYNAYLVQGREHTALVDTVEPGFVDVLLSRLQSLGVTRIDYLIANHAEQDHSGSIPILLERFPEARVVSTPKCRDMLVDLLHVDPARFDPAADGATLDLGGRTLEVLHAPWVHWPETMLTYLREDRILFPCDLFGSHVASSDLFVTDEGDTLRAAKRYYAEIMMPFRQFVAKHLERLAPYAIDVIAPSHGVVHDRPALILDAYRDWVSGPVKNRVVLPYVSMHGSTYRMVSHLVEALVDRGVPVTPFNLSVADIGELAMAMVDAATIVLATSTVLGGAHPKAVYAAYLTDVLRPKTKYVGLVGSFGWGGRVAEQLKGLMPKVSAEWLEPVLVKGLPGDTAHAALDRLADQIAERHRALPGACP
jgi:flavorubredoxin